jgi:hypothetical protein
VVKSTPESRIDKFGGKPRDAVAVNQVSLSFYPPRWQERLTPEPRSLTDLGTPVRIADAVPVEGAEEAAVSCDDFREWLRQQGFTAVDWGHGRVYYRGQVRSVFGVEKEIDVCFSDEAGELACVGCRFTLSREAPVAVPRWSEFVVAMCKKFLLRIAPDGTTPCREEEFLAAVKRHRFWREFAGLFGLDA